eukprot:GHVL01018839.1.p1 GENE.GHVL01018839.1~~GHVL01018839.1.p1  ORF type:complete len:528 (+),score=67.16 GHVL01018839.1:1349-2932(+)
MPVNRLVQAFASRKQKNEAAFVAYLTAGYDSCDFTIPALQALQECGVDVIEVGVPFSDPMADGLVIQEAASVALNNGVTFGTCCDMVKKARENGLTCPVVFMSYYNPIVQNGLKNVCERSSNCGVDGFIIVDLPPEHAKEIADHCKTYSLSLIPLIAPTTKAERIVKLAKLATSFVYCVSLTGVTGEQDSNKWKAITADISELIPRIKACTQCSVVVGFGISNESHVRSVLSVPGVDGFVVGSAIIRSISKGTDHESKLSHMKEVTKSLAVVRNIPIEYAIAKSTCEPSNQFMDAPEWGFGAFGGRFIPETLMHAHEELATAFQDCLKSDDFQNELLNYRKNFIGGPTPIYYAKKLTDHAGGAQIWFKREELAHTGAHKINNALAQTLLAKRMGKTRIIAETGAGQHGVATATACALFGLKCIVYMGSVDCKRQALNVFKMRILGAEVVPVNTGSKTLKDAINEAMRDWVTNIRDTHYVVGSAIGPHPFPDMVTKQEHKCSTKKDLPVDQGVYQMLLLRVLEEGLMQ